MRVHAIFTGGVSRSASATTFSAPDSIITEAPVSYQATMVSIARTLSLILINSMISICCAWVISFCFTLGNIFSTQQSPQAFMISVNMWTKTLSWVCVSACFAVNLQPHQCTSSSKTRSSLLFWWFKIVVESLRFVIGSTIVNLAIAIGCSKASPNSASWRDMLVFLISIFLVYFDTTACSVATTRLFYENTVHGRSKSQITRARHQFLKRFTRGFRGSVLNVLSFFIAATYAYTTVSIQILGIARMAVFMIGSIALKICMQEAAKYTIFQQKVHSVAIMAALVGTPTILIHTHMAVMMLRAQSLSSTLSGTFSTAVLEIFMRVGKALFVNRKIRRETQRRMAIRKATTAESGSAQAEFQTRKTRLYGPQQQTVHELEFITWKTQLLHYNAAKIYVDMFAEYVALGCAYAILVLFWNHPMFQLRYEANSDGVLSKSLFDNSKVFSLILQVGIKIAVDYATCVFETTQGINMKLLHEHNIYLAIFLTWTAVGNITIAAHVFFHPSTNKSG